MEAPMSRTLLPLIALLVACAAPEPERPDDSSIPEGYGPVDPVRAIYLGDSITSGIGASRADLAYRDLLLDNAPDAWPQERDLRAVWPGIERVDVSFPGATSSTMLTRQIPRLLEQLPGPVQGESVVIFTIGGNDMQGAMVQLVTAGEIAAEAIVGTLIDNLTETLDHFADRERYPDGVTIYFTNVYDPTDDVGQADECFLGLDINPLREALFPGNAAMRALAEQRGVAMLDMYSRFQGHGVYHFDRENLSYNADDPTRWFADDCIHPNDRGHHEIRRMIADAVLGH